MSRETIGVDVDDVLAAHIPSFIEFSNERYETDLTVDGYNEDWTKLWAVDHDELMRRAKEFHDATIPTYARIDHAAPVLGRLAQQYNLVVVTARTQKSRDITHAWLGEHFPDIFSDVHFVPIWESNNTVTKADICKQIGADYLIDDVPRHCNTAAEMGIPSLLFGGYTWTKAIGTHPDVTRVNNWIEVEGYFNAKS